MVTVHELVIRNGTIVDGSGSTPHPGDIAIGAGRITKVGRVDERGSREIDAEGHVVTPGFINGHTHMDAQVMWDYEGTSTCFHGVTSVVMGNCGFTLAPAHPDKHDLVTRNLERAEDMPKATLAAGIKWEWGTFPEYMTAIENLPKGINYAANIGHSSLRPWAMGERAFEEQATEDDLELMERTVAEAIRAGAVGFTTSVSSHVMPDGRPVASRIASWDELRRLVAVVANEGGLFEFVRTPAATVEQALHDTVGENTRAFAHELGVAMTWDTLRVEDLAALDDINNAGGRAFGQTHSRGVSVLSTFRLRLPFDGLPEWQDVRSLDLEHQRRIYEDPEARRRLVDAAMHGTYGKAVGSEHPPPDFGRMMIMDSVTPPYKSVAEVAKERGIEPADAIIALGLETNFDQLFWQQLSPLVSEDEILTMMKHPRTVMALSDAGAHLGQISDYSIQTYLLDYWVREREEFTLEEAVHMLTEIPADIWGFSDRGLLREGNVADLNVFDPVTVAPDLPTVTADYPAGAKRFHQTATGFLATIVSGEVTLDNGEPTGALPGKLFRGPFAREG